MAEVSEIVQIVEPKVELRKITEGAVPHIAQCARTCYLSEATRPDENLVRELIQIRGHDTVLEHATATWWFQTNRGMTHEFVRHRIGWSFLQESTRWIGYDRKFGCIQVQLPPGLTPEQISTWTVAMQAAAQAYMTLREQKAKPEIARSVLPTCTATRIVATANFKAWRHVFKMRCSREAHPDMKFLMDQVLFKMAELAPPVFDDLALFLKKGQRWPIRFWYPTFTGQEDMDQILQDLYGTTKTVKTPA